MIFTVFLKLDSDGLVHIHQVTSGGQSWLLQETPETKSKKELKRRTEHVWPVYVILSLCPAISMNSKEDVNKEIHENIVKFTKKI